MVILIYIMKNNLVNATFQKNRLKLPNDNNSIVIK